MNKATNFEEWLAALAQLPLQASTLFIQIKMEYCLIHNSMTPVRIPGYNWHNYLPGDKALYLG